jgi:uncharacterized protein YjiS (DUF1127 family)
MPALVIHLAPRTAGGLARSAAEAVLRAVATLRARFAARRNFLELSRLDDRALKDIGWCRTDLLALGWGDRARAPVRPAPAEGG